MSDQPTEREPPKQSPLYKYQQNIDYLGNFPGAEREKDRIAVFSLGGQIDVTDRPTRLLGEVTVRNGDGSVTDPATESTLVSRLARKIEADDGTGTFGAVQRRGNALRASLEADQVGLATESTLSSRLAREIEADDGTGTFGAVHRSGNALLVQHDGVIDVSSRDGRNLGEVAVNDLPDHDEAEANGSALAAGGSVTFSVSAAGADRLLGTISSTGTYDLAVSWQTSTGTEIKSESVVSGATAGTATDIDLPARTPYAVVTITDTSAASQTVNGVAHLA